MRKIFNNIIVFNILVISMCAILFGCSVDNETKRYSTEQVLIDEYGLTLNPSKDMYISFESISKAYTDTMACMGMTAAGPTVEFRSFSFAGIGGAWAVYIHIESIILINTDEDEVILRRDSRTDIEALEHEFIHHVLHMNGAGEQSRGHASPLFRQCGMGVRVIN